MLSWQTLPLFTEPHARAIVRLVSAPNYLCRLLELQFVLCEHYYLNDMYFVSGVLTVFNDFI